MRFDEIKEWVWTVIITMLVVLIVSAMEGCKSVRYVPVETIKTDSVVIYKENTDSLLHYKSLVESLRSFSFIERDTIISDSVYVYEREDGTKETYKGHTEKIILTQIDSVYNAQYITELKELYEKQFDSLTSKKNTIEQIPYPVEKELTLWQKIALFTGNVTMVVLAILACYYIISKVLIKYIVHNRKS